MIRGHLATEANTYLGWVCSCKLVVGSVSQTSTEHQSGVASPAREVFISSSALNAVVSIFKSSGQRPADAQGSKPPYRAHQAAIHGGVCEKFNVAQALGSAAISIRETVCMSGIRFICQCIGGPTEGFGDPMLADPSIINGVSLQPVLGRKAFHSIA